MRQISHLSRRAFCVAVAAVTAMTCAPPGAAASGQDDRHEQSIEAILERMTLEDKVGQLFVTYAYGATADASDPASVSANRKAHGVDNAEQLIEKYRLGGIIYFGWSGNLANPRQIAGLSNGVQAVALAQPARVPLLVSTDQEHGAVYRFSAPATQFPGSMALGAARVPAMAFDAAEIAGRELRAVGINQNFAPVADVNVNAGNPVIGVRSFGSDPGLTARLTGAQVGGFQRAAVSAAAKHFPGHGDTTVDSHTGLPVIGHSLREWERVDAPPFRAAIARKVDSIMTAHIVVPALDPSGDPATLSPAIITGVLRDRLGYDGVVITDALTMAGVRQKYGDARIPVLALKAGVDQLLMPVDIDLAYNAVLTAVRTGELTERRIDESVRRVLRMKAERGVLANPFVDPGRLDSVIGAPEHVQAAQAIADRTTTLVRNEGVLPLPTGSTSVLTTGWGTSTSPVPQRLAGLMAARGASATALQTGANPTQQTIDAAVAAARSSEVTVAVTNKAWADPGQQRLVDALIATGKPVVVLAVRDPYDIAHFPDVPAYLASYSYADVSLEAAVRVLYGELDPSGKLPVTIPSATDPATTLYPFGHGLSLGTG